MADLFIFYGNKKIKRIRTKRKKAIILAIIKTSDELIDTIKSLTTPLDTPSGTFSKKMKSSEMNTVFQSIEISFNKLYEKLRQLEDLDDFARRYIQNEFKKDKSAIEEIVKEIEHVSDKDQDAIKKEISTSFSSGDVMYDRDGSAIDTAEVISGNLIMPYHIAAKKAIVKNAITQEYEKVYRRVSYPVREYRSFYALEKPAEDGVVEIIQLLFERDTEINFVNLSAFGANIDECYIIAADNSTIKTKTYGPIKSIVSKGFMIVLKSTTVTPITAYVCNTKSTYTSTKNKRETTLLDTIYDTYTKQGGATDNVYQ